MQTGFWFYDDPCFDTLAATDCGDVSAFLHGCCPIFAQALHDRFGYGIVAAFTYDDEIERDALVHMFCETPEGYLVDIRGITDDWAGFMEAFEDEFCDLDDDVYVNTTDAFGFEDEVEYEKAARFINEHICYYQI